MSDDYKVSYDYWCYCHRLPNNLPKELTRDKHGKQIGKLPEEWDKIHREYFFGDSEVKIQEVCKKLLDISS